MVILFLTTNKLDFILCLCLLILECFKNLSVVVLELGGGGVSESSESELSVGGCFIAVIIVLVTVPKTIQSQKQKGGMFAFLRNSKMFELFLNVNTCILSRKGV